MRGFARVFAAVALWVVTSGGISAVAPAMSSAAEWQRQTHIEGEAPRPNLPLLDVSCPSASFCVAVGELDTIASSTDPTGGASAWGVARPTGGASNDCHEHWVPPCRPPTSRRIRGVSCPSAQLCVAVTGEGYVYSSTNPTGPGDAWRVADVDGDERDTHLLGVSCPTASLCVAVSGERFTSGKILTATDPTGGSSAWTVTQLDETLDLRGVSCGTPTLCVAVGRQGRLLVSTNPTGGAPAWTEVGTPGGPGDLQGVSCAATVLCVAGNASGNLLTSTNPLSPASWHGSNGGASVQVTDVSCLPSKQCLAVDNNGGVIVSTDPASPNGHWSRAPLIPFVQPASERDEPLNGLFGASCPSSSFCAVAGADGQIFTSTDPFADPAGRSTGSQRLGKKVKRPKARIAKLLLPTRRALREHNAHATVRFFAKGPVRRFECKVDRHRFHRCRSPYRFPIGRGTHAIRVRAVGTTGLPGPAAVKRFWLGKRCNGHQCFVGSGVLRPTG